MKRPRHAGRITATAAALALALGAAAPARAQFWPELTDKQKKGRFRLGPLALTPRLELRNAGVDTNIFVTSQNPVEDRSIVLRASADAYVPVGRRMRLFGTGWLDLNYFASESDQGSVDPGGQARAEVDAWRLTFVAGGGGFSASQLYSIDIDERIDRNEKWVNGGFRLRLSSQLRLDAGVEDHEYRWYPTPEQDQAIKAQLDRDSVVWKGVVRYKITLTDLVACGREGGRHLPRGPAGPREDHLLPLPRRLRVRREGVHHRPLRGRHPRHPGRQRGQRRALHRPAFQASITAPFLGRFRLGLGYVRDVYYSSTGGRLEEGILRNTYTDGLLSGTSTSTCRSSWCCASPGATRTRSTCAPSRCRGRA